MTYICNWDESGILKDQFPSLFCVVGNPGIILADMFIEEGWSFQFRSNLLEEKCMKLIYSFRRCKKFLSHKGKEDKLNLEG